MRTLAIPDLLRGLILQKGWSTTAAAHAAGISPVAAQRWSTGLATAAATWLRLISAFRAEVRIACGDDCWVIAVLAVAQPVRERERRAWRNRRFLHYLHAIAAQNSKLKRMERESRARSYVANEEARIVAGIEEARRRMTTVLIAGEIEGMRAAVQALIRASHISTDELSFASGVGSDAASAANEAANDGRLLPLRRLLAVLDARLELHLPSGNRVVIARVDANRSSNRSRIPPSIPAASRTTTRRRLIDVDHDGSEVRSSLERESILKLYDAGIPITQIAQQAGISRQRVHAIAKSAGRTLRRAKAAVERAQEAELLLS